MNWDYARSITSIRMMAELGVSHGMTMQACLAGTGVKERELHDPTALITAEQELQLIRNLVAQLKSVPALGIEAGLRYHFTAFGMLGFAMASSPNVRGALELALRYFDLTFAFTTFRTSETADETIVTIDDDGLPEDVRRFIVERDCAALVCVQRDLAPHNPSATAVYFAFTAPTDINRYQSMLGIRPVFGAKVSHVKLKNDLLLTPLPQANETARRAAEEQCLIQLERLRSGLGLASRIRDRLIRESQQMPDISRVAQDLCMTPRTLRRRLDMEGTSFTKIRDAVRLTLAEELLSTTRLSIEQIAIHLSYSEPTCFINAFKRWKGITPLAFRKSARNGP